MNRLPIPKQIHRGEHEIVITWEEGHVGRYAARDLRLACQCASCRDEMTGAPLLAPDHIPEDIRPLAIALVGSYAIRIDWSDGHNTGIYAYDALYARCPCERCRAGAGPAA